MSKNVSPREQFTSLTILSRGFFFGLWCACYWDRNLTRKSTIREYTISGGPKGALL